MPTIIDHITCKIGCTIHISWLLSTYICNCTTPGEVHFCQVVIGHRAGSPTSAVCCGCFPGESRSCTFQVTDDLLVNFCDSSSRKFILWLDRNCSNQWHPAKLLYHLEIIETP